MCEAEGDTGPRSRPRWGAWVWTIGMKANTAVKSEYNIVKLAQKSAWEYALHIVLEQLPELT